jgi:hypothetical protein
MAQKHKVSYSVQRDSYRLTAEERRAARVAGIAGKQGELKREAAERRAKRAAQNEKPNVESQAAARRKVPTARRSNSR